jgi:hypothetical protein
MLLTRDSGWTLLEPTKKMGEVDFQVDVSGKGKNIQCILGKMIIFLPQLLWLL